MKAPSPFALGITLCTLAVAAWTVHPYVKLAVAYLKIELRKRKHAAAKNYNVLLLGLDGAGKSSILKRWIGGTDDTEEVTPTDGFNVKTITTKGGRAKINFRDVGGARRWREWWHKYYGSQDALVWVVDGTDSTRATESITQLQLSLAGIGAEARAEGGRGLGYLLVLLNKLDAPGWGSEGVMTRMQEVAEGWRGEKPGRHMQVRVCSAQTKEGIDIGLSSLLDNLYSR